ncbi:MAG: hypothetical protein GF364_14485 [Candidatus Lokiarchaeota archaeon]|nr:hypothetical protein [Candidatus Lokiarchaeota archaeon]
MTLGIDIDPSWCSKVEKLVERFNNYAVKRSLNGISETLQSLINYMNTDTGRVRKESAEALDRIRIYNDHLITEHTSKLIDQALKENEDDPDYDQNSFAEYLESMVPEKSRLVYEKPVEEELPPDYSEIDNIIETYGEKPKKIPVKSYEPETKSFDEGGDLDALMALSIKDLKLRNVHRVEMKEEFNTRKCALGDGEFKDYAGKIYQCECGTLYHETCLKIQAIYTGSCHICDRIFLDKKNY